MQNREIKYYSKISKEFLGNETKYLKDKILIKKLFNADMGAVDLDTLMFRLTIIDSYYSTQMNKRFFGIEDIAEKILLISKSDIDLKSKANSYLNNNEERDLLHSLFEQKYGYNKKGVKRKTAPSLISKYLYFLCDFNFPIYDTLVAKSYPLIKEKFNIEVPDLPKEFSIKYFDALKELNQKSEINSFDKLDNFLWLYGKLLKGSFSLILTKNAYLSLVKNIKFKKEKSNDIDDEIREYLKENINSKIVEEIFSKDMIEFMKFCFNL